jgi:predicted dehydrogenase
VTSEEARAVIADGERRGLLVTVYHNRRWDGDLLTARRLLAEGALGRPLRFESSFERWRPAPRGTWRDSGAPEEGGGLLFDIGSHLVDQALHLFGPATRVYAELDRRRAGVQVEDDVFVALEHADGVRSHLRASAVAAQYLPRLRVLGSAGAYVKHGLDGQEALLRAGARPGAGWGEEPPERWGLVGTAEDATPVRTEPGAWPAFYAGVRAALRDGAPPPVDPHDAVAGLAVIEAARRSAATGATVALPPRTGGEAGASWHNG